MLLYLELSVIKHEMEPFTTVILEQKIA